MKTHEILGLEPYEVFEVKGHDGTFMLDSKGAIRYGADMAQTTYSDFLAILINDPDLIIHRTWLTEEQISILKAVKNLGCNWFTKDDDGRIEGWEIKPYKTTGAWIEGVGDTLESCFVSLAGAKAMRIEQIITYDEPLDIVQTLKDARVEV